ncbi:MAG TPA: Maf family protein [Aquabacterium sp.]|uniref:Maf family protein n=1 Tax=Aquabacterium sp. TaxID=1872578 RepID=UPI002E329EBB|nr:Maf family protein [Aquabacterium sp.]HEX5371680.1 Maf family protein [Aquabacterium sp.]
MTSSLAAPPWLYLASQSPCRRQLLESPDDYVRCVTMAKYEAAQARLARADLREIDRYVASGEPMGKAAAWTAQINGSYSGIMGLPLFETAELRRPLGWRF